VGGRFSALTLFGLVPAAVIGVPVEKLLMRAQEMAKAVADPSSAESQSVLALGVSMAHLALQGRNKLTLLTSSRWEAFGDWAEQLIAESLGKEGKGVVPVVRETGDPSETYGADRYFVTLETKKEPDAKLKERADALSGQGHPVFRLVLKDDLDLGAEFFRWEAATAIAGAVFKIDPFDQPNVQEAKDYTKALLKEVGPDSILSPETVDLSENTVRGKSGQTLLTTATTDSDAWKDFWKKTHKGDYVGILAFLPDRPKVINHLKKLQHEIRHRTGLTVTLGIGPRYLHSTGQLPKFGFSTRPVFQDASTESM